MLNNKYMMNIEPKEYYKVFVKCQTYNQKQYIEDALNGFALQKTNFPFVCVVIDDASSDGEQDVIKKWMDKECNMQFAKCVDSELSYIIKVPHKTNSSCTFVFYLLKKNLYCNPLKEELIGPWSDSCEYEAICEGDDYWIDSNKLQKQVVYMDAHPSCLLCCSDAVVQTPDGDLDKNFTSNSRLLTSEEMIIAGGAFVQTATFLFRHHIIYDNYPRCCLKCHVGDYPLQIYSSLKGNVYYIAEKMVVYRYGSNGSWTENQKKTPVAEVKRMMSSEIDMLYGLNDFSNKNYQTFFFLRAIDFMSWRMDMHRDFKDDIYRHFYKEVRDLSIKEIIEFLQNFKIKNENDSDNISRVYWKQKTYYLLSNYYSYLLGHNYSLSRIIKFYIIDRYIRLNIPLLNAMFNDFSLCRGDNYYSIDNIRNGKYAIMENILGRAYVKTIIYLGALRRTYF